VPLTESADSKLVLSEPSSWMSLFIVSIMSAGSGLGLQICSRDVHIYILGPSGIIASIKKIAQPKSMSTLRGKKNDVMGTFVVFHDW
jgi:disulfide bond formation protein DsbB